MANRNYASAGKLYTGHVKPVLIDCNFIVDSTNGNGLGIRSLKGPYVQNVFMNTSAGSVTTTSVFASGATVLTLASVGGLYVGMAVADSSTGGNIVSGTLITSINVGAASIQISKAAAGSSASAPGDTLSFSWAGNGGGQGNSSPYSPNIAVYNPNPAAGTIVVQLQDGYSRLLSAPFGGVVSPVGSSSNTISQGVAYIVTSQGTTTQAQWLAAGIPLGVLQSSSNTVSGLPNVGTAFIGAASGAMGGTGTAAPTAAAGSNMFIIEGVGDANQAIAPNLKSAQGFGSQLILQCRNASGSSAASAIHAPANNSVISLTFLLSDSSVLVGGE